MTPEGWRRATVADVAEVNPEQLGGDTPAAHELLYLDIASVERTGHLGAPAAYKFANAPSRARRRVRSGDIIVSTVRPYLRSFAQLRKTPPNLVASTGFAVVRPLDVTDSDFLYQHVLAADFVEFLKPRMKGGNYPAVTGSDVASYPLVLPPPPERRKIAAILSSVDDAIEASQAVIGQLQVVKKAMMAELLTKGLPGRHKKFKQTEIGQVPDEWIVYTVGEILADGPTNGIYKPAHLIGRGTLLAGMTAIDDETLRWAACRRAELDRDEDSRYGLAAGDILVTRVYARIDGVGRFIVVPDTSETTVFESNMMRIRVDRSLVRPGFLAALMRLPALRKQIEQRATLGAQASLNSDSLRTLPVCLPPLDEQDKLMAALNGVSERLRSEQIHLAAATDLKSALMSILLTGEVRVRVDEEGAA